MSVDHAAKLESVMISRALLCLSVSETSTSITHYMELAGDYRKMKNFSKSKISALRLASTNRHFTGGVEF